MPPYLLEHFRRSGQPFGPDRPDGYIPLCVAENKRVWDLLAPKVRAARDVPPEALGYADMVGPLAFRTELARFLGERVLGGPVDPEHVMAVAGAGSVLESLFWALGDAGDGVLVPTPSYAGFWMDLELRDRLTIVTVDTSWESGGRVTPEQLDAAVAASPVPIKALLFTTPNNPLGTVYTAAELEAVASWAERRGVHVVFDEIYALSVFGSTPFTSIRAVRPTLGEHIHIVWAFSKDFAASGLRCGVLVSENAGVRAVMNGLAYWSACSGDTLHLIRDWITDDAWLDTYIPSMQRRLGEASKTAKSLLDQQGIAYADGGAGFFLLVDLRPFLATADAAGEEALWRRLLDANVNLTPGSAIRSATPGLFRLCFAGVSEDALVEGLRRIAGVLGASAEWEPSP